MKLKFIRKKNGGRDHTGRVVVRHQGGEQKRYVRVIDFKRDKRENAARVIAVEYDPNRTADLALIQYTDGEKRYILAPEGMKVGDKVNSGGQGEITVGHSLPMKRIPVGTVVHNVELTKGRGGQLARGAGVGAIIQAREDGYIHLKLPSGEVRKVSEENIATIGQVGNANWKNEVWGKAGRKRRMGVRPTVRGVAMNPRSHPHGGGEGRSSVGRKSPMTYAGRKAVGNTRNKNKYSKNMILRRRNA